MQCYSFRQLAETNTIDENEDFGWGNPTLVSISGIDSHDREFTDCFIPQNDRQQNVIEACLSVQSKYSMNIYVVLAPQSDCFYQLSLLLLVWKKSPQLNFGSTKSHQSYPLSVVTVPNMHATEPPPYILLHHLPLLSTAPHLSMEERTTLPTITNSPNSRQGTVGIEVPQPKPGFMAGTYIIQLPFFPALTPVHFWAIMHISDKSKVVPDSSCLVLSHLLSGRILDLMVHCFQSGGIGLSVQYRMHPQIRDFPSRYFYQGRLIDSGSVVSLPDEVYYKDPLLKPYLFYDITRGRESHRGGPVSYQNVHEAVLCLRLYEYLQKTSKSLGAPRITVGIVTPYKMQLKYIQREFESVLRTEEGKRDLYINTVDAFQGQERDVISMSSVHASNHGVGFVADIRRMNVALTRARRAMWVMGNASALVQSDDWAALIADDKARNCYMDMDSLSKDFTKDLLPKDFSGPRGLGYSPSQVKTANLRGLRSVGPRHRSLDVHMNSRSGTPSEDEEKSGTTIFSRNGNYRPFKPPLETSLDDIHQSADKSIDAWQYGIQKKQNFAGTMGKRDS
ncbi:DNA-binding protein SMUBP-2-like [Hibiscus syriacus]|uniref:DNA-binding protein SMUBP-2-like n=1 Tax=Hibiscus syriacus TaxID=106335 RepID=UPI0019225004|nr:DNA-binding protein SMUBP-2-like [Hibiscus syriacus]